MSLLSAQVQGKKRESSLDGSCSKASTAIFVPEAFSRCLARRYVSGQGNAWGDCSPTLCNLVICPRRKLVLAASPAEGIAREGRGASK